MKNQSRILKKDSKPAISSQPKTAQSSANARPECNPTCIALFPEGDTSLSEEIVDLSKAEYAALKRAAAPSGSGVLMFMANAALEKAGWAGETITCILTRPDGTEVARVDFPRSVLVQIDHAASKLGISIGQFFVNAIQHFIDSQGKRRAAR
jgi:uncharacterized protein (DUF1778 family)